MPTPSITDAEEMEIYRYFGLGGRSVASQELRRRHDDGTRTVRLATAATDMAATGAAGYAAGTAATGTANTTRTASNTPGEDREITAFRGAGQGR